MNLHRVHPRWGQERDFREEPECLAGGVDRLVRREVCPGTPAQANPVLPGPRPSLLHVEADATMQPGREGAEQPEPRFHPCGTGYPRDLLERLPDQRRCQGPGLFVTQAEPIHTGHGQGHRDRRHPHVRAGGTNHGFPHDQDGTPASPWQAGVDRELIPAGNPARHGCDHPGSLGRTSPDGHRPCRWHPLWHPLWHRLWHRVHQQPDQLERPGGVFPPRERHRQHHASRPGCHQTGENRPCGHADAVSLRNHRFTSGPAWGQRRV